MGIAPAYAPPRPIDPGDRLEGFDGGHPSLDAWLKTRALDNEGRLSRTYVVVARAGPHAGAVVAFYTLATGSVLLADLPRRIRHNLPNPVPVLVLGRLAVQRGEAGRGLGGALLREAMLRSAEVSRTAGVRMLVVHPIDGTAAAFYARYGFQPFPPREGTAHTLYLPIETILAGLE